MADVLLPDPSASDPPPESPQRRGDSNGDRPAPAGFGAGDEQAGPDGVDASQPDAVPAHRP